MAGEAPVRRQSKKWTDEEHNILVNMTNVTLAYEEEFPDRSVSWEEHWDNVSQRLDEKGFDRTPLACRVYYRRLLEQSPSGEATKLEASTISVKSGVRSAAKSFPEAYGKIRGKTEESDELQSEEGNDKAQRFGGRANVYTDAEHENFLRLLTARRDLEKEENITPLYGEDLWKVIVVQHQASGFSRTWRAAAEYWRGKGRVRSGFDERPGGNNSLPASQGVPQETFQPKLQPRLRKSTGSLPTPQPDISNTPPATLRGRGFRFSDEQRAMLLTDAQLNGWYPNKDRILRLCKLVDREEFSVRNWFNNNRNERNLSANKSKERDQVDPVNKEDPADDHLSGSRQSIERKSGRARRRIDYSMLDGEEDSSFTPINKKPRLSEPLVRTNKLPLLGVSRLDEPDTRTSKLEEPVARPPPITTNRQPYNIDPKTGKVIRRAPIRSQSPYQNTYLSQSMSSTPDLPQWQSVNRLQTMSATPDQSLNPTPNSVQTMGTTPDRALDTPFSSVQTTNAASDPPAEQAFHNHRMPIMNGAVPALPVDQPVRSIETKTTTSARNSDDTFHSIETTNTSSTRPADQSFSKPQTPNQTPVSRPENTQTFSTADAYDKAWATAAIRRIDTDIQSMKNTRQHDLDKLAGIESSLRDNSATRSTIFEDYEKEIRAIIAKRDATVQAYDTGSKALEASKKEVENMISTIDRKIVAKEEGKKHFQAIIDISEAEEGHGSSVA